MMDIWANPHQRFGMIHVNVLIGDGVRESDRELFFGPLHPNDVFLVEPDQTMSQLLAKLGIYESASEATRHGWRVPIPEGFSDHMRIRKLHRVTILKVTA